MKTAIVLTLAASLSVMHCGCGKNATQAAGLGRGAWPKSLRYCYVPNEEEAEKSLQRVDRLRQYLVKELGIPVEMVKASSYGPTIEAMRARKTDVASFGPFAYLLASERAGAEAIVVRAGADGSHGLYSSIIAVPKDSPVLSLEELKANASKMTFAFTDPASTSGHLVPRAKLESMGLNPERDFKKVMFSMSHLAGALTLKAGKVDGAGMMETVIQRLVEKERMEKDDVRVLWVSEPMPAGPIAVYKGLPADLKEAIRDAFVRMPERDPELWKMISALSTQPMSRYLPCNDSLYDGLRRLARGVKHIRLLEQ